MRLSEYFPHRLLRTRLAGNAAVLDFKKPAGRGYPALLELLRNEARRCLRHRGFLGVLWWIGTEVRPDNDDASLWPRNPDGPIHSWARWPETCLKCTASPFSTEIVFGIE